MDADRARPIDLLRGPLFAYALFKAAPDRFYWYARYHHILLDALGRSLIASRLADVYSALATGLRPDDSSVSVYLGTVRSTDVAYRASNDFVNDRKYWLEDFGRSSEVDQYQARVPFAASSGFIRADSYLPYSTVLQLRAIAPGCKLARIMTAAGRDLRSSHDKRGGSSPWPAGCGPCESGDAKRTWHGDKRGAG